MAQKIKLFLYEVAPRFHNLPQCWYIRWMGYEWIIPKQ